MTVSSREEKATVTGQEVYRVVVEELDIVKRTSSVRD